MERRRFGQTGHLSSAAILGGFVFSEQTQTEAEEYLHFALENGINHLDIAPSYGHAEASVGPALSKVRDQFFLGCKTTEREKDNAAKELGESLQRLQTSYFDLYQIHAITSMQELDAATQKGGALEAMIAAREKGLINHIGITGHGIDSPVIFQEALRRFDFASILFPVSFVLYRNLAYRQAAQELLEMCIKKDVGVMVIKAITKGPWEGRPQTHTTWYEPITEENLMQRAMDFALSQPGVTGLCTAGSPLTFKQQIAAANNFQPMSLDQQQEMLVLADQFVPLFT